MKYLWLATYALFLAWSAIDPVDYFTWILEVIPALIGLVALAATYRKFRFTTLAYTLILIHCIILMIGGHYTYAQVPLFDWLKEVFDLERNNYDKVGHFAQGFVPAIVAREIVIRRGVISGRYWLGFFVVCFCLAFSAFYELIEWWVAISTGESAEAFLGTQGYVWDTQSDMALALAGAVCAVLFFGRLHDSQLQNISQQPELQRRQPMPSAPEA
jgi:putative membrane protein